jgi:hypothetical protein
LVESMRTRGLEPASTDSLMTSSTKRANRVRAMSLYSASRTDEIRETVLSPSAKGSH